MFHYILVGLHLILHQKVAFKASEIKYGYNFVCLMKESSSSHNIKSHLVRNMF